MGWGEGGGFVAVAVSAAVFFFMFPLVPACPRSFSLGMLRAPRPRQPLPRIPSKIHADSRRRALVPPGPRRTRRTRNFFRTFGAPGAHDAPLRSPPLPAAPHRSPPLRLPQGSGGEEARLPWSCCRREPSKGVARARGGRKLGGCRGRERGPEEGHALTHDPHASPVLTHDPSRITRVDT